LANDVLTLQIVYSPGRMPAQKVKFTPGIFQPEINRRVDEYFATTGLQRRDHPGMYFKTAMIVGWFVASYALLVFGAIGWVAGIALALSLGLAMAAIGFNIQHDGNHGAYSGSGLINRIMALTLDLLGGSSYVWTWKHNVIHHSYPNISGADGDIDFRPIARLSPHQEWRPWHRFQHVYMWLLFGLLPMKWVFIDDYRALVRGEIRGHRFPRAVKWNLLLLLGGKLFFLSWAIAIPLLYHPVKVVLPFYLLVEFTLGVTLGTVFQLAHCVEEASFPRPIVGTNRMASEWAVHQVETTVDFARGNALLSWFLGGLNFQVEHHLFPHICHMHYGALSRIVEATCADLGVRYSANDSMRSAIASHFRWLYLMGRATGRCALVSSAGSPAASGQSS
jgi:linoleoyl-CoA desaturase